MSTGRELETDLALSMAAFVRVVVALDVEKITFVSTRSEGEREREGKEREGKGNREKERSYNRRTAQHIQSLAYL